MDRRQKAEMVVEVCRLAARKNFMAAADGNVSVRLGENSLLITPSGRSKSFLTPGDLVEIDLTGRVLAGEGKPSSEARLHLLAYRLRPDTGAVVHAHPPLATAFGLAGREISCASIPELMLSLGEIPTVPYAAPTTEDVPRAAEPYILRHDAMLLAHHGTLTLGRDLEKAWILTEKLEHAALVLSAAGALGGARELPPLERDRLTALAIDLGLRPGPAGPPPPLEERVRRVNLPFTSEFSTTKRMTDSRGLAHLIMDGEMVRRVCLLSLNPGTGYRGSHIHRRKTEGFYVAQGRARLDMVCPETGQALSWVLNPGDLVWMPPGVGHRVEALETLWFVELCDRPYEPGDDIPFDFAGSGQ